jgi:hypothetical protein
MYHWNRLKKLILGHGRGVAPVASPRPTAARVPSRRARQAELVALDRLGRGKTS